jgi:probable F420-dependent oxidoreductase
MHIGITVDFTDEGVSPAALARAAEERALESLYVPSHTHIPVKRETSHPMLGMTLPRTYYRALDPFVALASAATATQRLKVGTGVLVISERDPIITAKEAASVDVISNGRLIFGAAAGWLREEIANHGTDPATRGSVTDERLEAIIRIWTQEQAEFHGKWVNFDPIFSWPKPIQRPHPPLYLGGGPAIFTRIARFNAGWHAIATDPATLAVELAQLQDVAGPQTPVTVVYVGEQRAESINAFRELGIERLLLNFPSANELESFRNLDQIAKIIAQAG